MIALKQTADPTANPWRLAMPSTLIPVLRYQDAPKAIDWLVEAFGFERHHVVEGEAGRIDHAQLTFGSGMLMLGSASEDDSAAGVAARDKPTGFCVVVEDIDSHADRARADGAEIVTEPYDEPYGGRAYSCRDLEGNVWYFGSYDPWAL